jgi:hypothetical protein
MNGFEYPEDTNIDCEREMMANAFVRQLDEIAVREGCDLPVTLLIAIMRLFDEQTESRFGPAARAGTRYEFTRCGAINDAASLTILRCVRRRGHADQHFAASGERWADETAGAADYPGLGRSLRLLCFSGCGAAATHGRFCFDHRPSSETGSSLTPGSSPT